MRDGPLRGVLKRVAAWQHALDLRARRGLCRLRGESPWALAGDCRRCGHCCEAPAIAVGVLVFRIPFLRRLFLAWQRQVNGFELTCVDPETSTFVFRCTHFDRSTRACDSYGSRPAICRDYPRALLWQPNPELFPGCGYRPLPPNAAGLRAAIDALDLPPERREKLRRGLRLNG